ncbi:MAG: hypothetical protein EP297_01955 [Gammaproteobacteria bacterium]|nr:MAG: hypothetical protein EP297_01955 [Gammaproteobacteria bacterium]
MAYVIKEHQPGRVWRLAVLLIIFWLVGSWLAFEYGHSQSSFDRERAQVEHKALESQVHILSKENRALNARISILERSAQVDGVAKAELTKSIQTMQEQEAKLREELEFFRGIVSPEKGKTGLNVYSFRITDAQAQLYHYKLLLTQATKNDRLAEGVARVKVTGVLQGQEEVVDLSEVSVPKKTKLTFKFRYFQDISGSFQLPDGFKPRSIEVSLSPKKRSKTGELVKTFDWSEIMVEEG